MPQPAKLVTGLPSGLYEITSDVLPSSQPIGVDSNAPPSQLVRGNAPVWVWDIKPASSPFPDGHRLSLVNAFPYTAVKDGAVIATTNASDDHVWYIYEHKDKYVIAAQPFWPTPAWTVSEGERITISLYEIEPADSQLFKLRRLPPG